MSPRLSICRHGLRPAGQPCRACTTEDRARRNTRVQHHGYGRGHWQRLRVQRLELDGYRCQLRLARCTDRATHVHLDPSLQGRHDLATLADCASCCASCSGSVDAARSHDTGGQINLHEESSPSATRNSDFLQGRMRGQR